MDSVTRVVKELEGFQKVELKTDESKLDKINKSQKEKLKMKVSKGGS